MKNATSAEFEEQMKMIIEYVEYQGWDRDKLTFHSQYVGKHQNDMKYEQVISCGDKRINCDIILKRILLNKKIKKIKNAN